MNALKLNPWTFVGRKTGPVTGALRGCGVIGADPFALSADSSPLIVGEQAGRYEPEAGPAVLRLDPGAAQED